MNIKGDRFLIKESSYVIDLKAVDFITFTQNENNKEQHLFKFHIGSKEARFMAYSMEDAIDILDAWGSAKHNTHVYFDKEDIKKQRRN